MKRLQKTQRCVQNEAGISGPRGDMQPSLQLYTEQGVVGNDKLKSKKFTEVLDIFFCTILRYIQIIFFNLGQRYFSILVRVGIKDF